MKKIYVFVLIMTALACFIRAEITNTQFVHDVSNYTGGTDTCFKTSYPNTNYETINICPLRSSSDAILNNYYIKFSGIAIPQGHKVVGARLRLFSNHTYTGGELQVWDVKRNVDSVNATWNSYDGTNYWELPGGLGVSDRGINNIGSRVISTQNGYFTIDIDGDTVQGWIDNPSCNNGMIISAINGCGLDIFSNESDSLYRPVLFIDSKPVVTTTFIHGLDYSGGKDTYLRSSYPDDNYESSNIIALRSSASTVLNNGYIKFSDISIPEDHQVLRAKLRLFINHTYSNGKIEIWDAKKNVLPSSATWNSFNGSDLWACPGGIGTLDRGDTPIGSELVSVPSGYLTIDIDVETVQNWLDNPSLNYGMMVTAIEGCSVDLLSNEYQAFVGYRPELIIDSVLTYKNYQNSSSFIQGILNYSGGSDTYFRSISPNDNYQASNSFPLRSNSSEVLNNGFIKFANISIPAGHKVISAQLKLFSNYTYSAGTIEVWEINKNVNVTSATWNSYDGTNSWEIPGGFGITDRGTENMGSKVIDIKGGCFSVDIDPAVIQDWIDNPSTNNGMMLVATGGCNTDILSNDYTAYTGYRPQLIINSAYIQDDLTLGWYASAWGPGFPYDYSSQEKYIDAIVNYIEFFRNKGLNTIMPYHIGLFDNDPEAWLKAASLTNIKIIFDIPTREMIDQNDYTLMCTLVNTYKNHPALKGWYLIDEPIKNYTHTQVSYAYNLLKTYDPSHPIHVVHCDSPQTWVNSGAYCDVLMFDKYPIFDQNNPDVPWTVAVKAREVVSMANQQSWINSCLFVVQDFGEPVSKGWNLWDYPSEEQLRYMSYAPIVEGTKGIMWYVYEKYNMDDSRYGIVPNLASEISSLAQAILSNYSDIEVKSNYDTDSTGHGIEDITYRLGIDDESVYLIAINNTEQNLNVTFYMTGQSLNNSFETSAVPVEIMFENNRTISSWQQYIDSVKTWIFSDNFGAYDVNVYRLYDL